MAELEPFFVPDETCTSFGVKRGGWYALGEGGLIVMELGRHEGIVGVECAIVAAGHSLPKRHFGSTGSRGSEH